MISSPQLLNLCLRLINLASRFLLIIFLAKALSLSEFGIYGLLVASISYILYIVGLDFYTYSNRYLIKSDFHNAGRYFKSQLIFFVLMHIILFPIIYMVFRLGVMPISYIVWFYFLLILGHINQEFIRIFVALSQPLLSTLTLFLRSGLWSLAIVFIVINNWFTLNIKLVFLFWGIGELLAFFLGWKYIKNCQFSGWKEKIDCKWIKKGLYICVPLLLGTLASRTIWTLDKYLFEMFYGIEALGVYVFFVSISMSLSAFVDSGVISFYYPSLVSNYAKSDIKAYRANVSAMLNQVITFIILFVTCAYIGIEYLMVWLDKPFYLQFLNIFYILLVASSLNVLSLIPHYILYSQQKDKKIIFSHISALFVFLISVIFLKKHATYNTIPLAICVSIIWVLIFEFYIIFKNNMISRFD